MALEAYRRKRNFDRTAEPKGDESQDAPDDGLRFVVQKHAASRLHYDFRLELDGVLKSWAVPKGPSLDPGERRLAMHVEDHPIEYGSFEGIIPRGEYGGGTVLLWDAGYWRPRGDARRDYERGRLKFRLDGEKLRGTWNLVRMGGRNGDDKASWLLIKDKDEDAVRGDDDGILERRPESVASGRSLEQIAADRDRVWSSNRNSANPQQSVRARRKPPPRPVPEISDEAPIARLPAAPSPQLATLVSTPPAGDDWVHEIKLDGYRILCRIDAGEVRLISRNGKDWSARFAEIAEAAASLPIESALLDGEVVVLDEAGRSDFQALQNVATAGAQQRNLFYFAFDLLHLEGRDITGLPLLKRKALLATLVGAAPAGGLLRYSDHIVGHGKEFFEQACGTGLEGIISKRATSPYRSTRNTDWQKTKCLKRQEFVIVGYTEPSGSRSGFGALVLAVNDGNGQLIHSGRVGTGFTDASLRELHRRLQRLETRTPSIIDPPRGAAGRDIHWVKPSLVAEVAFTEWTGDGVVRHPSFQGLREDRKAEEIVRETEASPVASKAPDRARGAARRHPVGEAAQHAEIAGVRLSNPDRILWPEQNVTKRQLAEYYADIADAMLPHVRDRALTLVRCPSGRQAQCFYQKHAGNGMPDIVPRMTVEEDDGPAEYLRIDALPAVIALVQLGALEFHVTGSRADRQDRPDRLVMDLDPDEDLPWTDVVAAALLLRERLADLGLRSFVKTTGGKGLHVVVPIQRRTSWDDAKAFTRGVAEQFVAAWPGRFTATMSKKRRTGKIYIDYLRNSPSATSIAAWSTRARPGAPVATPLEWAELESSQTRPTFGMDDVLARLRADADPWRAMAEVRQSLTAAMLREAARRA
jgi:bifunctional non-homologous end joining protein LigD